MEYAALLAIAGAFASWHIVTMDRYRMQNVQADTEMRQSLSGSCKGAAQIPAK
jgi:uncharacterized protein YqfA (UPF0365 family)